MRPNHHVVEYLKDYVVMQDPRYAVLLKGKWGCGKTFFIQQLINEWSSGSSCDEDTITLKPIYVSLYGVNSIKTVTEKIKEALNPFLYSKGVKFIKRLAIGVVKVATKVNLDLDSDGNGDGSFSFEINPLNILFGSNESVKGNKILIFDDIERCNIPLDELFGYVNNFVEHSLCKVILLAAEDKIRSPKHTGEHALEYKDFKEKLVGQTFEIYPDYEAAIDFFLAEIKQSESLKANKDLIQAIFNASKIDNLRILRQCLSDFCRLEDLIEDAKKQNEKYGKFIKELLCYFMIFYCEYKSGNTDVRDYQNYEYRSILQNDGYKAVQLKYEGKYLAILTENRFKHSSYSLKGVHIINFLENGFLDKGNLDEILSKNDFFNEAGMQPSAKLRLFFQLDDSEFDSLYEKVKSDFDNNVINGVYEMLDIYGQIIHLTRLGLVVNSLPELKETAKKNIDSILSDNVSGGGVYSLPRNAYTQYASYEEFNEIENYLSQAVERKNTEIATTYIKSYFENLNNSTIGLIYEKMKATMPDGRSAYELTSIFQPLDIAAFARRIITLNNQSKVDLINFIRYRYGLKDSGVSTAIDKYHLGDLPALKELRDSLNQRMKGSRSVEKCVLTSLVATIGEAIEKMHPA